MKRYCYVQAGYFDKEERDANCISFWHCFVLADDDDHAYLLGSKVAKDGSDIKYPCNDYVVEL